MYVAKSFGLITWIFFNCMLFSVDYSSAYGRTVLYYLHSVVFT